MTRTLHHTSKATTVRKGVRKHAAKKAMRRIGREEMMDTLRQVTHELADEQRRNERALRMERLDHERRNERCYGVTYN